MKALRLTPELLLELGFKKCKQIDFMKSIYFEKQIDFHEYLRIYLGKYPDTNPNSGIAMLYIKELNAIGFDEETLKKMKNQLEEFTDIELRNASVINIKVPSYSKNIASHLVTYNRLEALYYGLTGTRNFDKELHFEKFNRKNKD